MTTYLKNKIVMELLDTGLKDATERKIYVGDYLEFTAEGMVATNREIGRVLVVNGTLMVNDYKLFGENPDGVHNHGMVYVSDSFIVEQADK
jgi:hypothetical protein